jgi:hypothetical protein
MQPKRTEPTRSLLSGMPYVPASKTDIRVTFARYLKQQKRNLIAVEKKQQTGHADTPVLVACCFAGVFLIVSGVAGLLPGGVL